LNYLSLGQLWGSTHPFLYYDCASIRDPLEREILQKLFNLKNLWIGMPFFLSGEDMPDGNNYSSNKNYPAILAAKNYRCSDNPNPGL
jgi:hypothetical protein